MSTPKHAKPPSSGIAGFFQDAPVVESAFEEDEAFKRIFKFYLPREIQDSIHQDLTRSSQLFISPKIFSWCADAERNTPSLQTYDSWGRRIDKLITSTGWQELQNLGIAEGIVAIGHEREHKEHSRLHQFLKYHVWSGSCAYVTCPSAMTDGAARLLELQLAKGEVDGKAKAVFQSAHERLTSRVPGFAWTSGQWMTERPGGSDVRNTETQAIHSADDLEDAFDADGNALGPYLITGFKWFSSATDANSTVLLAQEPSGGIGAFFAPTRRKLPGSAEGVLNGIQIQRLKNKLGTKALPTAELILDGMRAWRIGKPDQGTKEISPVLNITRVHNAVGSMGHWGRGLSISRAFARVRKARNRLLMDTPAHVRTLAEQHVEYRAMMHLTFFTVALLGKSENAAAGMNTLSSMIVPQDDVPHLLRLMTPLAKMLTAKAAIAGLQECMESLGGVGYLENEDIAMNIARLFRDCNVLSIWEGTTNIMADDLVRIVKGASGRAVMGVLEAWIRSALASWQSRGQKDWAEAVDSAWKQLKIYIMRTSKDNLVIEGRVLGKELGWIVCAVLLGEDALSDDDKASGEICSRWISCAGGDNDYRSSTWTAKDDRSLVFGEEDRARL